LTVKNTPQTVSLTQRLARLYLVGKTSAWLFTVRWRASSLAGAASGPTIGSRLQRLSFEQPSFHNVRMPDERPFTLR
jgi:hypothetical protein